MRFIFFAVISFFIIIFSWATIKLGFFKDVIIVEKSMPAMTMIYKEHIGPYHKMLPTLESVEHWADENKIDCQKSFGHFLDSPDVVEHERLRSHVGCIVDKVPETLPHELKAKTLPQTHYFVAEFDGSPALGPIKVYKKAFQFIVENGHTPAEDVIEIYHRLNSNQMKTYYLFKAQ